MEDTYHGLSTLFGCAAWRLDSADTTLTARSETCKLCAIAKKMGAPKPCEPYCINPFAANAREFGYELTVERTLWDGDACVFVNRFSEAGRRVVRPTGERGGEQRSQLNGEEQ